MDINQISFSIIGSAGGASRSLATLTSKLNILDTSFGKTEASGRSFISMLQGISASLGSATTGAGAYKAQLSSVTQGIRSLASASKRVTLPTTNIRQMSNATKVASSNNSAFGNSLRNMVDQTGNSEHTLGKWLRRISQVSVAIMLLRQGMQALIGGIKSSISYTENLNLFTVALGENAEKASGFIKQMSSSFYLDTAELTRTQGLFYQISNSLGLVSTKAYTLSENFTKMAYDLASFYNITVDEAVTKLQAGLVGETEPLRRIGIIITENNLAETARSLGIKKSIRNMTEQEKIQLRYVTALNQTKNAQGDLARTMLQPENMLRILTEQFQILARNIGNSFIPTLLKVVPHLIAITSALADMAQATALAMGFKNTEILNSTASVATDIADANKDNVKATDKVAKNLAKILKYSRDISSSTTGIDELNILNQDTNSSSYTSMFAKSANALASSIDVAMPDYENNMSKAMGTFTTLKKHYTDLFTSWQTGLSGVFETTQIALGNFFKLIKGEPIDQGTAIVEVRNILSVINEITTGVINGINDIISGIKTLWNTYLKPLLSAVAPNWLENVTNGKLADAVETLFKLFVSYNIVSKLTKIGVSLYKIKSLIGYVGIAMAGVEVFKIALEFTDITDSQDLSSWTSKVTSALLAGFETAGITGNPVAGIIVFGASLHFELGKNFKNEIDDMMSGIVEHIMDFFAKHLTLAKILNINWDKWIEESGYDPFKTAELQTLVDSLSELAKTPSSILSIADEYKKGNIPDSNIMSAFASGVAPTVSNQLTDIAKMNLQSAPLSGITVGNMSIGTATIDTQSEKQVVAPTSTAGGGSAWEMSLVEKLREWYHGLFPIAEFANGGVPKKGNLFVAGEDGAELVTEHNGETVVMNEEQLAQRGISLFANGTSNVPKWTPTMQENAYKASGSTTPQDYRGTAVADKIDKPLNSILKWLGKINIKGGFTPSVSDAIKWMKDSFKAFSIEGISVWEGIKKSKTFGWLTDALGDLAVSAINVSKSLGKNLLNATSALFQSFKENRSLFMYGSDSDKQSLSLDALGNALSGTGPGMILSILQQIESGNAMDFLSSLPEMVNQGVEAIKGLLLGVAKALPDIMAMIPDIITNIIGFLTDSDNINTIIQAMIDIVNAIVIALPDIIQALLDAIPKLLEALIKAVVNNFPMFLKLGWNIGVSILEGIAKIIATGIDVIISPIRGILKWFGVTVPKLSASVDFSNMYMANGGYPDAGQMFIAREAGAELVGNIGGQTGVANNDQIVEAVSAGVYKAVSSAMAQQTQKEVVVNLDGRKISDNQRRVATAKGLSFGMGGF